MKDINAKCDGYINNVIFLNSLELGFCDFKVFLELSQMSSANCCLSNGFFTKALAPTHQWLISRAGVVKCR